MLANLFQSTTIPVLQQVVQFTEARHNVLAGNIANMDTPGYQVRDLSAADFQTRLKKAIEDRQQPDVFHSPGEPDAMRPTPLAEVAQSVPLTRHDQNNTSMEQQVAEMVKNQMQHNVALTIMNSQFRLLQTAINEKL